MVCFVAVPDENPVERTGLMLAPLRDITTAPIRKEGVVYTFTRDPDLLEEYYRLRGDMYALELGLDDFPRTKDSFDDVSDILVVMKDGEIIAGARITIKEKDQNFLLPLESEKYRLAQLLPELELNNCSYGEFTRLAVLPEHRRGHAETIVGMIIERGRECGIRYLFAIAPKIQARLYRKFERRYGFKMTLRNDLGLSSVAQKWGLDMPLMIFRNATPEDYENLHQ